MDDSVRAVVRRGEARTTEITDTLYPNVKRGLIFNEGFVTMSYFHSHLEESKREMISQHELHLKGIRKMLLARTRFTGERCHVCHGAKDVVGLKCMSCNNFTICAACLPQAFMFKAQFDAERSELSYPCIHCRQLFFVATLPTPDTSFEVESDDIETDL
jgi:hypothetical protein